MNRPVVAACAIVTSPAAYSSMPATITRTEPKRSATIPVNGCATPQIRFCSASASPNASRDQPWSSETGARNSPCT